MIFDDKTLFDRAHKRAETYLAALLITPGHFIADRMTQLTDKEVAIRLLMVEMKEDNMILDWEKAHEH